MNSHGLIVQMRAIQGHSGGIKVDPALLDNAEIPLQRERVPSSRWLFSQYAFFSSIRTDCREKMQKREDKQNSSLPWVP